MQRLALVLLVLTLSSGLRSEQYSLDRSNEQSESKFEGNDWTLINIFGKTLYFFVENMHNRMICENEKLQINCNKAEHVIRIERAYYGRYSITPCNKNHRKFAKGCTANDTLSIIRNL